MNRNFAALNEFKDYWRDSPCVTHLPTGNMTFIANVGYNASNRISAERTKVHISLNGYEEGRIVIEESGELDPTDFHLAFEVRWQRYIFDEDNGTLVVEGNSPKMGGDYEVRIHPRIG